MEDINSFNIDRFEKMIDGARRIGIVTHMKPDGDAIGSCTALYHYLKACGKSSVKVILNDRHPASLDFLADSIPTSDLIISAELPQEAHILLRDSDLIFCLDFNAFHRTDQRAFLYFAAAQRTASLEISSPVRGASRASASLAE